MFTCPSCHQHQLSFAQGLQSGVCRDCQWSMEEQASFCFHLPPAAHYPVLSGYQIQALFPYLGFVRETLMHIKAKGNHNCLGYLLDQSSRRVQKLEIFDGDRHQGILCCPSSLWSRLRGRLDLARELATLLAGHNQVPLIYPPTRTYLRVKKRALNSRKRWRCSDLPAADIKFSKKIHDLGIEHLVIIDDIVTSGFTMASIASMIEGCTISMLCIAARPALDDKGEVSLEQ